MDLASIMNNDGMSPPTKKVKIDTADSSEPHDVEMPDEQRTEADTDTAIADDKRDGNENSVDNKEKQDENGHSIDQTQDGEKLENSEESKSEKLLENTEERKAENLEDHSVKPKAEDSEDNSEKPKVEKLEENSEKPKVENLDDNTEERKPESSEDNSGKPKAENLEDNSDKSNAEKLEDNSEKPKSEKLEDNSEKPKSETSEDSSEKPNSEKEDDNFKKDIKSEHSTENSEKQNSEILEDNSEEPKAEDSTDSSEKQIKSEDSTDTIDKQISENSTDTEKVDRSKSIDKNEKSAENSVAKSTTTAGRKEKASKQSPTKTKNKKQLVRNSQVQNIKNEATDDVKSKAKTNEKDTKAKVPAAPKSSLKRKAKKEAKPPTPEGSDSESAEDEADFFEEHSGPRFISSSGIDRRRLAMVENRLSRRRPRAEHRFLGPKEQLPEVVGKERNIPTYSRAFRYDSAATNMTCFPHMEYSLCEKPPYKAGIHPLDRGTEVYLTGEDAQIVTTPGPYASAKANVVLRGGGAWYYEIEVVNPSVRIGIGRRESSCEGPVGYDAYSYGVQSDNGWKIHCARTSEFMEPFGKGDIIGFHVNLPVDSRPRNFERTRAPFLYQNQVWIESRDYTPTSQMEHFVQPRNFRSVLNNDEIIEGSFCHVYRNGVFVGPLAEPSRDFRPPNSEFEYWSRLPSVDDNSLGYYPMISVYRGGAARLNCGPEFKYPKPEGARGLHERYDEQVADDFTVDSINEIVFEKIDERIPKRLRRSHLKEFKEKKTNAQKFF